MSQENVGAINAVSDEQINAIAKSLTDNQVAVLVEAHTYTVERRKISGAQDMHWYHRGKFGFGISKRTALSLSAKGLVKQSIWEQWSYDTQFVMLTELGYRVAEILAQRSKKFTGKNRHE